MRRNFRLGYVFIAVLNQDEGAVRILEMRDAAVKEVGHDPMNVPRP
jgi:hypothetical protein